MKPILTTLKVSALVLTLAFTGCDKKDTAKEGSTPEVPAADTHLAVTKDFINELEAIAAAADSAKDAASATAAKAKLEASAASLKKIAERMKKLGKPKDEAVKKAVEAEGEKVFATMAKLDGAEKNLKADPALKPALDGFNAVGDAMKDVMSAGNE